MQISYNIKHSCVGLHRLVLFSKGSECVDLSLWGGGSYGGKDGISMLNRFPGCPVLREAPVDGDFEYASPASCIREGLTLVSFPMFCNPLFCLNSSK